MQKMVFIAFMAFISTVIFTPVLAQTVLLDPAAYTPAESEISSQSEDSHDDGDFAERLMNPFDD